MKRYAGLFNTLHWKCYRTGNQERRNLTCGFFFNCLHHFLLKACLSQEVLIVQSLSHVQLFEHHGLQHSRLPCPSPSPGACSNSCPLSQWCHPTISFSVNPFSSCPQPFPASLVFSSESALLIRWPKYWSFSFRISPSHEYSGLISFRIDWFDLSAVQGTLPIIIPLTAIIKPSTIFWMKKKKGERLMGGWVGKVGGAWLQVSGISAEELGF